MATVILGVSGSIAAYKAADVVSLLVKAGHEVHVVCTKNATEFITPLTLQTLSRHAVLVSFEDEKAHWVPPHIELAQRADLMVIAPATANLLAEMVHGLAPDALTSLYLACKSPVLVCPAMNEAMWFHPATQENVAKLLTRPSHYLLEPQESGELACGQLGKGKLAKVEDIVERIEQLLSGDICTNNAP